MLHGSGRRLMTSSGRTPVSSGPSNGLAPSKLVAVIAKWPLLWRDGPTENLVRSPLRPDHNKVGGRRQSHFAQAVVFGGRAHLQAASIRFAIADNERL